MSERRRAADLLVAVEAEWERVHRGSLSLDEDRPLTDLVLRMWREVERQREQLNAPEGDGTPIHEQVVEALEVLLSPEVNGA